MKEVSERYENGLQQMQKAQEEIYNYHKNLEVEKPVLQERMRHLFNIISEIEDEFARIKGHRDQIKKDEFDAQEQTVEALKIKDACEDTLNKIIPALNNAMNQVQMLSKYDLAELKSMKHPPKVIKLVMQVVCILFKVPPEKK